MKLTNKLGLPQAVVDAVTNDSYSRGTAHISITGLLKPPRIRILEREHADELEEDVSDRIYSLLGQSMHTVLERAAEKGTGTGLHEKRFYLDVLVDDKAISVSGQLDAYYEEGLVQDYKLVSLYKVREGVPIEYEQQLNCYAALLRHNGLKVSKLQLVCFLRDWSKGAAQRDPSIPQQQVVVLTVPLWSAERALQYLTHRVRVHKHANQELPLCTPEERWATDDKWAVMVKGKARAVKLHMSREDADTHAATLVAENTKAYVEERPGENKRCDSWCSVSSFCTQAKALAKKAHALKTTKTKEQA